MRLSLPSITTGLLLAAAPARAQAPAPAPAPAVSGPFAFTVLPADPRAGDCVWVRFESSQPMIDVKVRFTGGLQGVYRGVRVWKENNEVNRVVWTWLVPNVPRGRYDVSVTGKPAGTARPEKGGRLQGGAVLTVEAPPPPRENLVENGDFEKGADPRAPDGALTRGWEAWKLGDELVLLRTEGIDRDGIRVRHGLAAWRVAGGEKAFDGGLLQTVRVPEGRTLRLRAHAHAWCSKEDDPHISVGPGRIELQVGIDPAGGKDPAAAGVAWSKPVESYDEWAAPQVTAPAAGGKATVFLRARARTPLKHNETFWDGVTLETE